MHIVLAQQHSLQLNNKTDYPAYLSGLITYELSQVG